MTRGLASSASCAARGAAEVVEGFIVSVDSVFFVPRHSSLAVFWVVPPLAAEELEIDGMEALTKNAW